MPQFARPIFTLAAGEWTASSGQLWECIDEITPSDTDFISHAWVLTNSTASFNLSAPTTPIPGTHVIRVRARMANPGPYAGTDQLRVTLRSHGSFVAEILATPTTNGTTWTTYSHTLTAGEIASLAGYTGLSVDITRDSLLIAKNEVMQVSWFEFEVPDAPGAPPGDARKYFADGGTQFYPPFVADARGLTVIRDGVPGFGVAKDFAPWNGTTFRPGEE